MSNKKELFELHGFKVMDNSIYLVADKRDYNAPTGFQEKGVTKLPSEGVGNTFHCPYKRTSATDGVWDSGFYEFSPCYDGRREDEVQKIVAHLNKNVAEPYRKAIGNPDALKESNHEFFDTHRWSVTEGQVFKTNNPVDRVALYFALLSKEVAPKERKDDSTFIDADYVIVDVNEKIKKRDEDASMLFEAIGMFEVLRKTDKDTLDKILYYLGRNISDDTGVEAYRGIFKAYLEASHANVESFLKLVKEADTEDGIAKLNIYYALKKKELKNTKVSKVASGVLYYEDTEIGADLKTAAANIAKNPNLREIKKEILFGEDED